MIPVDSEDRLRELTRVFLEENANINLSAFRTEETCWIGNVMDSLSALEVLPSEPSKILDIGTGGGFPLLPLAICLPNASLIGLDSTQKKIDAVDRIARKLNIQNVQLINGRAEELGHDAAHREQYDFVLSRAVAPINVLLEYCAPFTKLHGTIILWKSLSIDQELQESLMARAELSCQMKDPFVYELPETWGKRQLLIFEKRFETKKMYPRAVGVPKKSPLL